MKTTSILSFLILTLAVAYSFIWPAYSDLGLLRAKKSGYEDSLAMVNNIEMKRNELQSKYDQIPPADKKNIETVVPDNFDFVRLISQIDNVGAKYGISISSIGSRVTDPSVGNSVAEAAPPRAFQSAIISFSFTSSYQAFTSFINDLEKSLRILDIRVLKIDAEDKGVNAYNVELETYWVE